MTTHTRNPFSLNMMLTVGLLLAAGGGGSATAQDQADPEYEIVLIHGLGGSAEIWDEVVPNLEPTFKVWTFELAGHGSTQPVGDPSIDEEVIRLRTFMDTEEINYPTLAGHGLGGMIALQYAIDFPQDVHRLILIDTAPKQLASQEEKTAVSRELVDDYDRFVARRYLNMSPMKEVTDRVLDIALRTDSATFISLLMSSFDFDVTADLYDLEVPLLVVGSQLMFPDEGSTSELLEIYGFGEARTLSFKRMPGSGHYMMMEKPVTTSSVLLAFGVTSSHQFEK
jgi:pimeloyl-ACP methyl ester carboxylesterase